MTVLTITRDLPCSVEAFWTSFLDSAFVVRAFTSIGFVSYEILELREEPARLLRRADARPPVEAPAVVQKALGPSFGYVEEGEFDRATKTWTWSARPSVLAERSRMEGRLLVEPLSQGAGLEGCRTKFEANVEVKLLGVGVLVESAIEKSMRASWTKFGDFCASTIPATSAARGVSYEALA
jgi:Protein of unknown function (DUF2505)